MAKSVIINIAIILELLIGPGQARSLTNGRSGYKVSNQLPSGESNRTYIDVVYDYDSPLKKILEQKKEKDILVEIKKHQVLDDKLNYDYTYGDDEFNYDEEIEREEKEIPVDPDSPEEGDTTAAAPAGDADGGAPKTGSKDKGRTIVTPIVTSVMEWVIRNWKDVKHVRDTWVETKAHVQKSWGKVKKSLTRITSALGWVLVKFGQEAEEGLKYCLVRLNSTKEQINEHGLEAINKLEKLLEEGNETAASFFRLIGVKLGEIARKYSQESLFTKNLTLSQYFTFEDSSGDGTRATVPNLFEDKEVLSKLNLLVEQNILEQEEVESLVSAAVQQALSA